MIPLWPRGRTISISHCRTQENQKKPTKIILLLVIYLLTHTLFRLLARRKTIRFNKNKSPNVSVCVRVLCSLCFPFFSTRIAIGKLNKAKMTHF